MYKRQPPGGDRYLAAVYPDAATAFDYLPEECLICVSEAGRVQEALKAFVWQVKQDVTASMEAGLMAGAFGRLTLTENETAAELEKFPVCQMESLPTSRYLTAPQLLLDIPAKQLAKMCIRDRLAAAHGLDETGHLAGAAAHESALETGHLEAIQKTGGDTHHVLGGGAHLVADHIPAVIKADEVTGKRLHQTALHVLVFTVDDHAVGDAAVELLHVARPQPHGHGVGWVQQLRRDLTEPSAGPHLQTLHT